MPINLENIRLLPEVASPGNAKNCPPFNRLAIALALISLSIGVADAQTDAQRIADLERKLQKALNVIDKLSDKVDQLEVGTQKAPATKPTASVKTLADSGEANITPVKPTEVELSKTVAEQNTRIQTMEQQVTQLSSAASSRIIPFDWLHGFADVGGGYSSSGHPSGFGVGNLDLYMTPKLGGQVRSLFELVFEYDRVGNLGTDLERAQIGYAFNDQANVWLGRFHTPYGYWQTAFHHGAQIQPSLLRPRFIDFEDKGGFLPAHTTGVWGTGGVQTDGGKISYDLYVGNSYSILPNNVLGNGNLGMLDQNAAGFNSPSISVGGKLSYIFNSGALDGLNVGLHGLRSEVQLKGNFGTNPTAAPTGYVDLNMGGGYLYYNNYDWEVISEFYAIKNQDRTSGTGSHNSWAGFVHAGYAIDKWMPYMRLENANTSSNDPYFRSLAYGYAYAREAVGLRFDVNTQSALKLEFDYTQPQINPNMALRDFWESRLQYAIRF
jgi:uncharacterized coiled-coil protein SlyX